MLCTCPPLPPFLHILHARSAIMTTVAAFCRNSSFAECVLREISGDCVDTKLRRFEGTYIVSGGRGQPQASTESDQHCGTERSGLQN